jgi:hypothetical protein
LKKEPALEKMKMLNEFTDMLAQYVLSFELSHAHADLIVDVIPSASNLAATCRTDLQDELLSKGILRVFKEWLSPLPDLSLPNLTLRSQLYILLEKVFILSQICRLVIFDVFD